MASIPRFLFLALLSCSILLIKCDDEDDDLLRGINQYRTSLNLTALTKNDRAECLADKAADKFKDQPCTNTSAPNTRFSDYPDVLKKCHFNNVTTTSDGRILPACVPGLQPGLILSNFTMSQYAQYLNDTQFSGIGIDSEDDWIVVVLTASTPNGSSSPGPNANPSPGNGSNPAAGNGTNPGNGACSLIAINPIVFLLIGVFVLV